MIDSWWPMQIGVYSNPNHIDLSDYCFSVSDKLPSNNKNWISNNTYSTIGGNFNIVNNSKFIKLNEFVYGCIEKYCDETGMMFNCKHKEGWFNVYNKGDYQEYHVHPTSILSAVYFMNDSDSKLFFRPPYLDHYNISYEERGVNTQDTISYDTKPGNCIIFRSFLQHCVSQQMNSHPRVTLAFNFS